MAIGKKEIDQDVQGKEGPYPYYNLKMSYRRALPDSKHPKVSVNTNNPDGDYTIWLSITDRGESKGKDIIDRGWAGLRMTVEEAAELSNLLLDAIEEVENRG